MTKVGINGFGRIGRQVVRLIAQEKRTCFRLAAINDPGPGWIAGFAHLLKYDSVHGPLNRKVEIVDNEYLKVEGIVDPIKFMTSREIPNWKDLGVKLVMESSGKFTDAEKAKLHLTQGRAERVLVSAPSKGADATFVYNVNHETYDPSKHLIVSNASCTTNCLAPIASVLDQNFGIEQGLMTTIHAYTNDQVTLDGPHSDVYRSRAAALSMIPTTTGAAKAVGEVLPQLKGKLHGLAIRVPTPNVSLVDLTVNLKEDVSVESINKAMEEAASGKLKGTLYYNKEPLVSIDFNNFPYQSIFDATQTIKIGKNLYKVFGWYDNEYGFTNAYIMMANYIAEKTWSDGRD
ncbi:MAG: type I glyceraldehyde-3-phosphate dehydrogenase [Candidatus Saganbacteria bacterium]|nr:type I glyceraldehyde-3-phosphate dehydrogenase [Candidatus Saganbacteria bacterium]